MRTWTKPGLAAGTGLLGVSVWAGPAAASGPEVSGTVAVGGTITVSSSGYTLCDGISASASLGRPIGNDTTVPIISGSILEGDILVIEGSGSCTSPDGFQVNLGSIEVVVGAPVQASTTTSTTSTPPAEATTTAPPAPATTAAPPAAAPAQELPRTGGVGSWALVGAALVAAGASVLAAARRRPAA